MKFNKISNLTSINETLRSFEAENISQNIEDVVIPLQLSPVILIQDPAGDPKFYDVETISMTVTVTGIADYYGICGQVPKGELWEISCFAGVVNSGSVMSINRSGMARSSGPSDLIAYNTDGFSSLGMFNSSCSLWYREGEILYYFIGVTAWTSGNATFHYTIKKHKK